MQKRRSKRYAKCQENIPKGKQPLDEAIRILKALDGTGFDATVELVMHLGIDPRQADQALRGSISLPHGIGKTRKVIAFCEAADAEKAKAAGAIEAGREELIEKIQKGWMDFEVAVAHPAMMKLVSKLGRVLGPSGKMPSPKAGTVTPNIAEAVKEFAAGKVEYRNDDGGNLHVPVGKVGFEAQKLLENLDYFISFVKKAKPATAKGTYIKKVCISATMTPSVEVDVA